MTTNKITYETGATSHAVNDLILFTENTSHLAELRDHIYSRAFAPNDIIHANFKVISNTAGINALRDAFSMLLFHAVKAYCKELPESCSHVSNIKPLG